MSSRDYPRSTDPSSSSVCGSAPRNARATVARAAIPSIAPFARVTRAVIVDDATPPLGARENLIVALVTLLVRVRAFATTVTVVPLALARAHITVPIVPIVPIVRSLVRARVDHCARASSPRSRARDGPRGTARDGTGWIDIAGHDSSICPRPVETARGAKNDYSASSLTKVTLDDAPTLVEYE